MPYPCNRCNRPITPQPSMVCPDCVRQIDQEATAYADRTMRESDEILAEWRRQDKELSKGSGCAVVVLALTALPFLVDQMRVMF